MSEIKEFKNLPSGRRYLDKTWDLATVTLEETIEKAKKDAWNAAIRKAADMKVQLEDDEIKDVYISRKSILNCLIE